MMPCLQSVEAILALLKIRSSLQDISQEDWII